MIVKGGVPIRRIPKASSVSIQAGQRVFRKRADGTYDPASITLRAEVKNVMNPKYAWGRIVNGIFQSNGVIYNTLVVNPAYTGVIAVRVRGDNIPNYIEEYTSISVVDDGLPGTHYEIVFTQDNLVVDSIACTSDNYPKISPSVLATLYKIEGNKKQECTNYYSRFIAYGWNNEIMRDIIGDTQNSYVEFAADSDDEMYFNVQFREKNGTVVAEKGIARVSDGDNGKPGQNGIPGCAIRRSEWKAGIEYRNDEAINAVTRYLDIAMVRANNSIGWRGYKCLRTHVSTQSNKPGNATYWEELPTNTVGILASLIIARDAKLDFLSGNEIRILDANDRVTAGVSGSGSGDKGIRFYAGSDDPQISPYRVNEFGELYSTKANIRGQIYQDWYDITKDEAFKYLYIVDKPNVLLTGWDWDSDVMLIVPKNANLRMNTPSQFTFFNTTRYTAKISTFYNDSFNVFLRDGVDICEVAYPKQINLMAYCRLELMFIPSSLVIDDELNMEVYNGEWHVLNQYDFILSSDKRILTSKAMG